MIVVVCLRYGASLSGAVEGFFMHITFTCRNFAQNGDRSDVSVANLLATLDT
jgi:hypothetical protein